MCATTGYSLAEVMLALSLLAISFTIGLFAFSSSLQRQEARASALSTQAATAWAQTGVLWLGGQGAVSYGDSGLAVCNEATGRDGDLSGLVPQARVSANISRWRTSDGVLLHFLDPFAAPDSGGSVFFECNDGAYRLVVRPVSGLTSRRWEGR